MGLSNKRGEPNWALLEVSGVEALSAVQWKLKNIKKLMKTNPQKHEALIQSLERVVGGL